MSVSESGTIRTTANENHTVRGSEETNDAEFIQEFSRPLIEVLTSVTLRHALEVKH